MTRKSQSHAGVDAARLNRRRLLKAAGATVALPLLDYFQPRAFGASSSPPVRRMLCICTPLGLHPEFFFPAKPGADYESTPYLDVVREFRDDFSVISGLSHPDVVPATIRSTAFSRRLLIPRSGAAFAMRFPSIRLRPRRSAIRRGSAACRFRKRGLGCPGRAAGP